MNNQNQPADFANLAKITIEEQWDFFPDSVYGILPNILQKSTEIFTDIRERDIFLLGTLAVFGGCFHNAYAYNTVDKKSMSPNLFAFIVAPPASGKRALQYSKLMASKIKNVFNIHGALDRTRETKRLFIPGNISQAGMIELLAINEGVGIIIESEIDTLVNANKQDWGNFTDIIRNAFENESYSTYRSGTGKLIEIDQVRLSMALSGTESQFKNLMISPENGLFSRGCYYMFENRNPILKSFGRIQTDMNIEAKFELFASIANDFYHTALTFEKVKVNFTEYQMTNIQAGLQVMFDGIIDSGKVGFEANVKRAFSVVLKIATTLSLLEKCESKELQEEFTCTEKAIGAAIILTLILLMHGSKIYDTISLNTSIQLNSSQQRLYYVLPQEFTKDEGLRIAMDIGLKERTAYNAINGLEKKGWIVLQSDGTYMKQV